MPYNTTAIPPRKQVTGQSVLPVARVKKILAQDSDISTCSANAAFVISMAAEMFIQHLATEAQNAARTDRKPRRNIQYKDMATAVAVNDNLEFLEDVIPRTVPYKKIKAAAAATRAQMSTEAAQDGKKQSKLPIGEGRKRVSSSSAAGTAASASAAAPNGVNGHDTSVTSLDDPNAQLELEMRQAAAGRDGDGDVSMADR